jgi:succinyl-diaminopimelate desuccinylase
VTPDIVELLRILVRQDTTNPPGNEQQLAEVLREWLARWGVESALQEFQPFRANLIARIRGRYSGRRLILNTHTDVVPAGSGWTEHPLAAEVRDGYLFGRGAADAKASLAAMAMALVQLRDQNLVLHGEIVLAAVGDEEVGSLGTRALLRDFTGDAAIVGEPTGRRLMTAHKGSVRPVIEVRGRSAHAAHPELGVNAIDGAAALLRRLCSYAGELGRTTHPLVGPPTLVPVLIAGGEALNTVAARCRITLDRRLIPGERDSDAVAALQNTLERFCSEHPRYAASIVEFAPTTGGPSETPARHEFVLTCQEALRRVGQFKGLGGLTVNCDMTHFRAAGIPTVIYGPGEPSVMHKPDERVSLRELELAVEAYVAMAAEWSTRSHG